MADTRRLPAPVADAYEWQIRAACRGMDSGVFFHPEGERGPARSDREARAKQICTHCPVLVQCRRHALTVHEPYGVWGGLSASERDTMDPPAAPGAGAGQVRRPPVVGVGSGAVPQTWESTG